jgi:hypothetical protein
MIALAVILAVATAWAAAAALRLVSITSFLLAVYLLVAAEVVLVIELLSTFGGVDRRNVLLAETVLLACAGIALFVTRGSARIPRWKPGGLVEARAHPAVALLLVAVVAALGYELALAILTPPNNWDSMSYHLSRAAAWYQHHRVGFVAAHTQRENVLQPNAEILVLFTFVFAHGDRWAAVWQWLAEVACLIAIYALGRRTGLERPLALLGALLFATLSQTVLQASTTQNDLLTASFAVTSVAFLASRERSRLPLAALALGLAVGTKITTAFALPGIALTAGFLLPRREWLRFAAPALAMVVVVGGFGYALNLVHTGSLLGAATVTGSYRQHSWSGRGETLFGVPLAMLLDFRFAPGFAPNEDLSYFGPLGAVLVVPIVVITLLRWRWNKAPRIHGVLALSLPLYVAALAFSYRYNPWIGRFMLIPAALVAPLFGTVQRMPRYAALVMTVALLTLGSTLLFNHAKPSGLGDGSSIWSMTRAQAQSVQRPQMRSVLAAVHACVPRDARIGYVLGGDDWDYPLYGATLSRRLVRLSKQADQARRQLLDSAQLRGLSWVLVRRRLVADVPAGWTPLRFRGSGLDLLVPSHSLEAVHARCRAKLE